MPGSGNRWRPMRPALWAMVLLLVLAGCRAVDPGSDASPSMAGSSAPAAATRTPLPSPTPLAGLPSELIGTWETDLTQYLEPDPLCPNCGERTRLLIHPHGQYAIAGYGPYRPGGNFRAQDDGTLYFDRSSRAGEQDCGNAIYAWELDGEELTFTALEPDPCGRRGDALDGVTYTRAE